MDFIDPKLGNCDSTETSTQLYYSNYSNYKNHSGQYIDKLTRADVQRQSVVQRQRSARFLETRSAKFTIDSRKSPECSNLILCQILQSRQFAIFPLCQRRLKVSIQSSLFAFMYEFHCSPQPFYPLNVFLKARV